MSAAAEGAPPPPRAWGRLESAAGAAVSALAEWRRRALKAEAEVVALRSVLESVIAGMDAEPGSPDELKRLRAENAVLQSRASEARRRVAGLMARLQVVEEAGEP